MYNYFYNICGVSYYADIMHWQLGPVVRTFRCWEVVGYTQKPANCFASSATE